MGKQQVVRLVKGFKIITQRVGGMGSAGRPGASHV